MNSVSSLRESWTNINRSPISFTILVNQSGEGIGELVDPIGSGFAPHVLALIALTTDAGFTLFKYVFVVAMFECPSAPLMSINGIPSAAISLAIVRRMPCG